MFDGAIAIEMRLRRVVDVDTGNPVLAVDHVAPASSDLRIVGELKFDGSPQELCAHQLKRSHVDAYITSAFVGSRTMSVTSP